MENKTFIIKGFSKPFIMVVLFVALSCTSKKSTLESTDSTSTITAFCPEDGKCTTQLLKNKSLNVKTDAFGATYYQLSDNNQTSVILYQYKRNVKKGLQDGNYTEEIIFEINNNEVKMALTDSDLQKTKMLFSRLCFCRGQTGYYKVTHGILKLEQKNNEVHFNLNFAIAQVPQIINSITAEVK